MFTFIQGDIGSADRVLYVEFNTRNAEGNGNPECALRSRDVMSGDGRTQLVGNVLRLSLVCIWEKAQELLTTPTNNDIARAKRVLESCGNFYQNFIARSVSVLIVDLFKAINIAQ